MMPHEHKWIVRVDALGTHYAECDKCLITKAVEKYNNPILNEREKTHGSFEDLALNNQQFKLMLRTNFRTWNSLKPEQAEALEMIQLKICRILSGNPNEVDHWKDIAGYAELVVASLKQNEKKIKQGE